MMIFGVCFVLYLIKLSAGKGVWNSVHSAHFKSAISCAILFLLVWSVVKFNWFAQNRRTIELTELSCKPLASQLPYNYSDFLDTSSPCSR